MYRRYLLHFAHEHISFRWPEFTALASKNDCKFDLISPGDHLSTRPFILIELRENSDEKNLIKSAQESYLLKDLYELWASSKHSIEDLSLQANKSQHFDRCKALHTTKPDQSFCVRCESFGAKISHATKMTNLATVADDEQTREYFFGRHLGRSSRNLVDKFSLKRRNFIANTSMDPLLSLIASNTAQVRANDLVFDPFVGSGSLLVAAAHMGAYVLGADIDWQLLHGKSRPSRKGMKAREDGECVRANMRQYGLESRYLDVMISDISRHSFKSKFELDAIIADPPYGIRESSERIGRKHREQPVPSEDKKVGYPSKINYHTADLIADLLRFSINHLRPGGRLVYYLPVTTENTKKSFKEFIPSHPDLELIDFCDQQLTRKTHRLMIVMEKRAPFAGTDEKVTIPLALSTMDFRGTYFSEVKMGDE